MRKLSLGLLTLAMAAVVFTSCKKDENAAPVVSFTNIADSISTIEVTADSYDLTVQVTSEAGLKEVKISETKNGTTTDKETISTFENNADFTKVYKVSGIPTSGMDVTISATDKDDQNTTRKISLKKKETTPVGGDINNFTGLVMGSSDNSNGSYLDAEEGKVYKAGALTADIKPLIDLVYETDKLYNTSNLTSATGAKFGETTITAAEFDAATTDIKFSALTADLSDIAVANGKIVFFTTKGGKKGLLKITAYTAGKAGQITVDEKIQK
jgi:hypothetical protein